MIAYNILTPERQWLDSPDAESTTPRRRSQTIVLAEDEQIVREFMAAVLRETGYTVFESADGQQALRVFCGSHDEKIDLLLTDIVMPVMGGKELVYNVSRRSPETKILFCSAYPEKLAERNSMIDKNIPFLQKPVTVNALKQKVRDVLREAETDSQDQAPISDQD